jgi:hypothetical protein
MAHGLDVFEFFKRYVFWWNAHKQGVPYGLPPVIVHDPSADGPKNLDDPFTDETVQANVGRVIASAAKNPSKREDG